MNSVIEVRASAGLPSYLPAHVDRELRTCVTRLIPPITAGLSRYSIAAVDAPSPSMRQALSIRRDNIDRWLEPAGLAVAGECYKKLVLSMAAPNLTDADAAREMSTFVDATSKLPRFALEGSCDAFLTGKLGDGKWMPKPGQICIEASKRVADLAKERREIHAVLTAEVKEPEANASYKAQNLAEAAALVAEGRSMEQASRTGRLTPEQITEQKIAAHAAELMIKYGQPDPRPMPPLSPYLRDKLGLRDPVPTTSSDEAAA